MHLEGCKRKLLPVGCGRFILYFHRFFANFRYLQKKQNVFAVMSDCYDELLRFAFLHSLKFWQQAKEKGRFRPSYCLLHLCDSGEFFPYIGLAVRLYASLRHVQFAGGEGGIGESAFVICE